MHTLDSDHRSQLRCLARQLRGVTEVPLTRELFRSVRLNANNRHYTFLIDVARLIYQCAIPDEKAGGYRFRDFVRNRPEMARLFEAFIFNFLRVERPDLNVSREVLSWDASSEDDPALRLLPDMRTDVTVRLEARTIVLDAKYYEETFQRHYDRKTLHSSNLYQLVAYLRNMERRGGVDAAAEGVLVYPVTAEPVDVSYMIQGHKVRVRTLDLAQQWSSIERDVLALV
jgi:5-methylcytosine-specific restriction enzyme subunit McrC